MQINNLKLQSKFHDAKPNHSRVISKSLKLRTGRVKTKEHVTQASFVPMNHDVMQACQPFNYYAVTGRFYGRKVIVGHMQFSQN